MMRKFLYLFGLSAASLHVHAQDYAIDVERQNLLSVGHENHFAFAVNDCPCQDIAVKADAGAVVKPTDKPCNFIIIPDQPGKTTLMLVRRKDRKVIGSRVYKADWVDVDLGFASKNRGGKVRKFLCKLSDGPTVGMMGFHYNPGYSVVRYAFRIYRKGEVVFDMKVEGVALPDEAKSFLQGIRTGDVIRIYDVVCKWPDGKVRGTIPPGEYTVVE